MKSTSFAVLAALMVCLHCQPEPVELQKRWKAHSVEIKNGANPGFAKVIQKEAFLDLRTPFDFRARIPESDTKFSFHNRMAEVSGMASIDFNDTIDKLELNLEYEQPEQLDGSTERMALRNASVESITIFFGMNDESGDGGYSVTFHPANQ